MSDDQSNDLDQVYDAFIAEALDTGCVWGLEGKDGWALCPSAYNDEIDVMPLWSQRDSAQAHCHDEWSEYQPVPISVEELLDEWLPGMHQDILLVGVDWDDTSEGEEVEPLDLLEDMDRAAARE